MSKKVVILGAGISGLSLGWFLSEKFGCELDVQILEASSRTGGWIQSVCEKGFQFELGPRSCRAAGTGIETLKLIEALGLQGEVIGADPAAYKRFLYVNRKLEAFPHSVSSFFFSPFFWPICKAVVYDLIACKGESADESVYEFTKRRFGQEAAELFLDPMTSGIYAGDIRGLSIRSCYPILKECEQRRRSVILGLLSRSRTAKTGYSAFIETIVRQRLFSFRGGMETLTKALSERLKGKIVLDREVRSLRELEQADQIISTVPGAALAKLCEKGSLKTELEKEKAASVAVVNFGFKHNLLKDRGFGYLIPRIENEKILGVVWDSCAFPLQNTHLQETRLTVMIGGTHMDNFHELKEDYLIDVAKNALAKHLGIYREPDALHLKIANHAIPQYEVGHKERVDKIKRHLPENLRILGSSYYGVAVNDCIAQAAHFAETFCLNSKP